METISSQEDIDALKEIIANRLETIRKKRCKDIGFVADCMDVHKHTVYNWERRGSISIIHLVELAQVYKTTVSYLVGETKNDAPFGRLSHKKPVRVSLC